MASSDDSRLDFSLDTSNGDYFDQVIGMSQEIINANFEHIHGSNKLLQFIHYDPPRLNSLFKAETLPPKIVLQANVKTNASLCFFVIRIKTGVIKCPGVNQPLEINGWELAAEVPLADITLRRAPKADGEEGEEGEEDEEDKKNKERQLNDIFKTFLVPGDYSVQRLYAALSSASWVRLNEDLTYCGMKDGRKIPFSTFKKQKPEYATIINSALTSWSVMMESKQLNNLGLKFELPKTIVPKAMKPTFAPFELITQTYPYKTPEFGPKTGYDGLCGNNCFLYCETLCCLPSEQRTDSGEMVLKGRKMGDNVLLGWNGNLAMPRSHRGIGNKVEGTFALHHKVILDRLILLQLQGLCQATELIVSDPKHEVESDGLKSFSPRYSLGRQPYGTPPGQLRVATDSYFEYKRDKPEGSTYTWSKPHKNEKWDTPHPYYKPGSSQELVGYSRHKISSLATVTVTPVPNTPTVEVIGTTVYKFHLEFGNNTDFTIGRSWKIYHLEFYWSIKLNLTTNEEGVMDIRLDGCTDYTPNNLHAKQIDYRFDGIEGTTQESMLKFMTENLKPKIQRIIENLRKELEACGRFVYPGHGQLKFGSPFWGKKGNLLADITYAPPPPGQQIVIPDVTENLPTQSPIPEPKSNEEPIIPPKVMPLLTWVHRASYDSKTKRTTLQIIISNKSSQTLYFYYLRLALLMNSQHKAIFNGTDFKYTPPKKPSTLQRLAGSLSELVHGKNKTDSSESLGNTSGTPTTASMKAADSRLTTSATNPWAEPPLEDDPVVVTEPPNLAGNGQGQDKSGAPVANPDSGVPPANHGVTNPSQEDGGGNIVVPSTPATGDEGKKTPGGSVPGDASTSTPVVVDPPPTGNTYFWVANNKVVGPDMTADCPPPNQLLELTVWGKPGTDYENRFHFLPGGELTVTLSGPGEMGTYRFDIHESWKDGNEEAWFGSTGDADQTFPVVVKADEVE
ncbi:hypothetical protein NLU13_0187 [Sarocladium strictum]|uniref:Uncharacterized protein n=1 Tax=Sarocladium strictum TaxID=5046 RepID=A0AA39GQH6_SARSR|nr:hypothetical protein NLU13_0187 [Sarocladium strictum]